MILISDIFWWTGAIVSISLCIMFASAMLYGATWSVKKAFNYWWDQTLMIYRYESIRHYFKVMVDNGRTGLLKEVELSEQEKKSLE